MSKAHAIEHVCKIIDLSGLQCEATYILSLSLCLLSLTVESSMLLKMKM